MTARAFAEELHATYTKELQAMFDGWTEGLYKDNEQFHAGRAKTFKDLTRAIFPLLEKVEGNIIRGTVNSDGDQ